MSYFTTFPHKCQDKNLALNQLFINIIHSFGMYNTELLTHEYIMLAMLKIQCNLLS